MRKAWLALLIATGGCGAAPRLVPVAATPSASTGVTVAELPTATIIAASQPERGGNRPRPTIAILFASWCGPCHAQLAILHQLRQTHPNVRVVGLSYAPFEEFNDHGDAARLREFVAANAPWLNVYTMSQTLYERLHEPSKIPSLWLFAADGTLQQTYDRATRRAPALDELSAAVDALVQPAKK